MTTSTATATVSAPATAPSAPPAPSTADMIHAIRTVQGQQAAKIGASCMALIGSAKTPLVMADLSSEVAVLAGLDLALTVLSAVAAA